MLYRRQNTTIEYDGQSSSLCSQSRNLFSRPTEQGKGRLVQARGKIEQSCDTWEIHALPVPRAALVQLALASALRRTRHTSATR